MKSLDEPIEENYRVVKEKLDALKNLLNQAQASDEQKLDLSVGDPQESISFVDVESKVEQLGYWIESLVQSKYQELVPRFALIRILQQLEKTKNLLTGAFDDIEQRSANQTISEISTEALLITYDDGAKIDVADLIRKLFSETDTAIYQFSVISHFLKVDGERQFYLARERVDRLAREISELGYKAKLEYDKVTADMKSANIMVGDIKSNAETANVILSKVKEDRDALDTEITTIETLNEKSQSANEHAQENQSEIEGVRASVAQSEGFIEEKQQEIASLNERSSEALSNISAHNDGIIAVREQIDALNADAVAMLQGATIAGLAGEYGKIRTEIERKLNGARRLVYIALTFLFISVIPMFLYSVLPFLPLIFPIDVSRLQSAYEFGNGQLIGTLSGLGMRSILLVPAVWFATFASRRYDKLFRLKEHYAFKYSVATSVEGFKQQAPSFKDEIAAATFFELTFNPADRLDRGRAEPAKRSSVLKRVIEKLGDRSVKEAS